MTAHQSAEVKKNAMLDAEVERATRDAQRRRANNAKKSKKKAKLERQAERATQRAQRKFNGTANRGGAKFRTGAGHR